MKRWRTLGERVSHTSEMAAQIYCVFFTFHILIQFNEFGLLFYWITVTVSGPFFNNLAPLTQIVTWMHISRSKDVQDVFWTYMYIKVTGPVSRRNLVVNLFSPKYIVMTRQSVAYNMRTVYENNIKMLCLSWKDDFGIGFSEVLKKAAVSLYFKRSSIWNMEAPFP